MTSEPDMKLRSSALALLLVVGTASSADLLACGDKFLITGRGTRFQRATPPRKPASILVYASPASNLLRALPNMPIDTALRQAGHRSTWVSTEEGLEKALLRGGWDLVLVDAAESGIVSSRLQGDSAPVLLRVVYGTTRTEFQHAKKQYRSVLRAPTKNRAFLDTIDEALSLRLRPAPKPAGKTTT